MSRQGSGPDRGTRGRASDAAFADRDAYQRDSYLEADAYPVDPGYQGYASGRDRDRPRPADMPPGPSRTRPERGMPPRPGYPPRSGRQAVYDPRIALAAPRGRDAGRWPSTATPHQLPPPAGSPWPAAARPAALGATARARARPGSTTRSGLGLTRTRPGPAQGRPTAPRGRRCPGTRAARVPGTELRRAGRGLPRAGARAAQGPQDGPAAGWPPRAGQGAQPAGYQPLRSGRPPGYQVSLVPCRLARARAGAGQYAAGQPWPGQQIPAGPGWPGAGQGPRPEQGAHGQGQPWPPGQPGYGQGEPGQGPAGYGQGQFAAGQPGPGQFGQGAAGRARASRPGPVRSWAVRPGPGAHGRAVRPAPGQVPYVAGPYSNANPYAAGQPGGPQMPGQFGQNPRNTGSWQAAGPQQGPGWAAGQGAVRPEHAEHRILAGRGSRARAGLVRAAGAARTWRRPGRRLAGGRRVRRATRGIRARGGPPGPSRDKAGHRTCGGPGVRHTGAWQAAGPSRDPAGRPARGRASSVRGSSPRASGTRRLAGGRAGSRAGLGGPRPASHTRGSRPRSAISWPAVSRGQAVPACAIRAGSHASGSPVIRQRDSALPDPPPGAKGPIAAIETDNVAAFARDLRVLRSKAGLDYPDMAEKSHYTMRTLASAAGGLRLPTLPVLIAYVNACGGDVADWEERWGRLTKSGKKGQALLPAGEPGRQAASPGPGLDPAEARGRPARSTSSPRPSSATPSGSLPGRGIYRT